jgi:hypothetical protein
MAPNIGARVSHDFRHRFRLTGEAFEFVTSRSLSIALSFFSLAVHLYGEFRAHLAPSLCPGLLPVTMRCAALKSVDGYPIAPPRPCRPELRVDAAQLSQSPPRFA